MMGDHLVLLMDRLITESTLGAAMESRVQSGASTSKVEVGTAIHFQKRTHDPLTSPRELVECRICQDEDEDANMESPCSCCGSMKYAHRSCVQRWCNEKGDTMCEICNQPFKPGYTAPQLFQYGGIPMNFRGNWEVSRRELHNSHFIAMVATDRAFLNSEYEDYVASNTRGLMCCRTVAAIFLVLLLLRHTLPILLGGAEEYSLFVLLLLRTAGVLVPVYIMARILAAIQRRRHQRETRDFSFDSV